MKKNLTIVLLIVSLLLPTLATAFHASDTDQPSGGGTDLDPLCIKTPEQFYALRGMFLGMEGGIRLEADIALNDETFTFDPDTGLVQVTDGANVGFLGTGTLGDASGDNTVFDTAASEAGVWYLSDTTAEKGAYTGEISAWNGFYTDDYEYIYFDGNGHTISGLYVNVDGNAGLFGYADANIQNLTVQNAYVYGSESAGGLAGYMEYGAIANCRFDGIVCGQNAVGGIAGMIGSNTAIQNCEVEGQILGSENIGGILGSGKGSVRYCRNFAAVSAETNAAGIAALGVEVLACMNLGRVSATHKASGISGKVDAVFQSINLASVTANEDARAVAQDDNRFVEGCYYRAGEATDPRASAVAGEDMGKKESFPALDFAYTWYLDENSTLPALVFNAPRDLSSALWDGSVAEGFAAGDGTSENPFIIQNASQLAYLAKTVNEGNNYRGKYIRLDADIQLNDYTKENWILGAVQWTSIGGYPCQNGIYSDTSDFGGDFDGNNHVISGLYMDNPDQSRVGLFGFNSWGVIRNLTVTDSFLRGRNVVGAIAGSSNGGELHNCHSDATVIGTRSVGGLAGNGSDFYSCTFDGHVHGFSGVGGIAGNASTLDYCQSTENATVIGSYTVGGVVGVGTCNNCENYASVIGYTRGAGGIAGYFAGNNCVNYADIIGNTYVGGIAGYSDSAIHYCRNEGTVKGTDTVGGIIGMKIYNPVIACLNDGDISGEYNVGGIVGYLDYDSIEPAKISLSRNNGAVEGVAYVGGIVGYTNDEVLYSYNTGRINGKILVGGLAGYTKSTITSGFNVGQVRGDKLVGAIVGDTAKDFYAGSPYLAGSARLNSGKICYGGCDSYDNNALTKEEFASEMHLSNGGVTLGENFFLSDSAWHPLLSWEIIPTEYPEAADSYAGGTGSEDDPYLIATEAQLRLLTAQTNAGNSYKNKYFLLTNDIQFTPNTSRFAPIGKFEGVFDGGNHTIFDLNIMGVSDVGLFSHNLGTIQNLTLSLNRIIGITNVGAIAGRNDGSIINCTNYGSVHGYSYVGGIAGYGGHVYDCLNFGPVRATDNYVGGIIGYGQCDNSENQGEVSGNNYVGGIVGGSIGEAFRCVNHGYVHGKYYIGGIAGASYRTVHHCTNFGSVSAEYSYAGGIVGETNNQILYCINEGRINSQQGNAAGILGHVRRDITVSYCINLGEVRGQSAAGIALGAYYPRGGTFVACYYVKGRVKTHNGTDKSGLGSNDDKYNYPAFDVIGIEVADIGKIETYAKIPDFNQSFAIERQRDRSLKPVMRDRHEHVYDTLRTTEEYLVSEGNCVQGNSYLLSCACGEKGTFWGTDPNPVADKHAPSGNIFYLKGGHYQICSDCKAAVKVSEHIFTEQVQTEAYLFQVGNCKTTDVYYYSCKCGEVGTKKFYGNNFGDHDYSQLDFSENGHFFTCTLCGIDNADVTPHDLNEGEVYIEPTTEHEGERIYTCRECDYKRYEIIEKLPEVVPPSDNDDPQAGNEGDEAAKPVPKGNDTLFIVLGVAAAVVALTALGLWIWKKKK